MTAELHSIAWQNPDGPSTLLVAGTTWLTNGLQAILPQAHLKGYVADSVENLVVERGALSLLDDVTLAQAKLALLIDPHDRERWRVESALAGRSAARIVVLPSPGSIGAAEQVMLLTLALARKLLLGYSAVVAGSPDTELPNRDGDGDRRLSNWAGLPEPGVLAGQTLGIIGLGRSGVALAERALGFGMRVIYYDITEKSRDEARLHVRRRRFDQLLRESDVVSLHLPVTPETRRMIDAPELASMKPTSILINVSDGRLVDEGALIKALRGGDIAGAGLDVYAYEPLTTDSPLIAFENVVLTPRIAWISEATEQAYWLNQLGQLLTNSTM